MAGSAASRNVSVPVRRHLRGGRPGCAGRMRRRSVRSAGRSAGHQRRDLPRRWIDRAPPGTGGTRRSDRGSRAISRSGAAARTGHRRYRRPGSQRRARFQRHPPASLRGRLCGRARRRRRSDNGGGGAGHAAQFATAQPARPWVLGEGWRYNMFPGGLPTRAQLDAVVADRPAFVRCFDYHTAWVNSKALALAGITATRPIR